MSAAYESFLFNNVSTISTVESSLRSLTWFLPGRFKDAELASEALSALVNVMSMYHDALLARIVKATPHYKPILPPSLHTKFTRAWLDKNTTYKWVARMLELLLHTQLLIEMGLRRKVSDKARWRTITLIETIKAVLRLVLLHITRRPLLTPAIPDRDLDPSSLPSKALEGEFASSNPPGVPDHLKNNNAPLNPLLDVSDKPGSADEYLLSKALTTAAVKPPPLLVNSLSTPKDWLSEHLYILRPLIYVTFIARGNRSRRPLLILGAVELLSRLLRRNPPPSQELERSEYARRDRDILWYLLRDPLWTEHTRPKIESLAGTAARAPLLSLVGAIIHDWIPLIDQYYYYTAP